jgi:tRNA uridine 5-carbamoylmethylation protein Kti12
MAMLIVITGIPGAGKSTIARLLSEALPRSVLISGDDLRHMVISGYRDPNDPWDDEMRSQYHLSFKNEAALTANFLGGGFDVVIDDVIRKGALYDEWLKEFQGLDHQVVLLQPSLEAALKRNQDRPEKTVPEKTLHDLHQLYQQIDNRDWKVIDNSHQTQDETVKEILARLGPRG